MLRKKDFFYKVIQMSLSMILVNFSGICHSIFVSRKIGAEEMGIFQLVMSVFSLGVSLSISGIPLTATRLLSDIPKNKATYSPTDIVKKCIVIALIASGMAFMLLFFGADTISEKFIRIPQTKKALKMLSPALLCLGLSSGISGYFTAFGKVGAMSFSKLCGETVTWGVTIFFIKFKPQTKPFMIPVYALTLSLYFEAFVNIILWFKTRPPRIINKKSIGYTRVLRLCTPIAVGSYLRTGLSGAENLLIPIRSHCERGVEKYGILKGMTLPVMMSASVFVGAFTTLIIPEIAARRSEGLKKSIKYISSVSIENIMKFAICISTVLFVWHNHICFKIYDNKEAGEYLFLLSALPIFMYLDSVCDAIIKGLDEQVFALKVNVADSIIRVILIYVLVPFFEIKAYIFIMYLSEIINLTLSYWKLKKLTALHFNAGKAVICPLISSVIAVTIVLSISMPNLPSEIVLYMIMYIILSSLSAKAEAALRQKHTQEFSK
ncbi:MAG: polysaccharide biosynthesis C-terminal domain-containing protein [Clostridia bacterium]|nr:polysaccharide biosynthesis C-terminal domain-containing protein [Clostridia bacterium]